MEIATDNKKIKINLKLLSMTLLIIFLLAATTILFFIIQIFCQ